MFLQMKSYVFNFYRFAVENRLLKCLKNGYLILDAGSGKGDSLRDYSKPKNVEVVCVDFLRVNAAASKRRYKTSQCIVADLTKLPFREGAFNGTFSVDVLEHVDNKTSAISELARVTKKGGFFVGCSTNVLNPVLFMDSMFPAQLNALVNRFSNVEMIVERHSRFNPSNFNKTLVKSGFELEHFALVGTPVIDEKSLSSLANLWVLFDKLSKKKPFLYLKETMVWQAAKA
jgi:ubiquinone/menaquinone biosynthesis C-methylase UbiE